MIEYLDCCQCNKEVKHEYILCNLCHHWVDAGCAKLNKRDLDIISNDPHYGDWFCFSCVKSVFPMMEEHDFTQTEKESFKKYLDCSVCTKNVTGQSLCCCICSHWVHRKCIDNFSTKKSNSNNSGVCTESFEHMNAFYKNKDWFCPKCTVSIFPLVNLDDEDFIVICYGSQYNMTKNVENICKNIVKINVLDPFNDPEKYDPEEYDHISYLGGIDADRNF